MRTPITLRIKFKSAGLAQFIERYSVDVSQSGIFIRTKEPLKVGTQLKFEFQLQDASSLIVGEGTVVWTRDADPTRAAMAPGMGVRFDQLTEVSRRVLDHILAEKAKRSDGAGESRFDAGVRASQFASGSTSAERDTNTPLPPPRPGLDGRSSEFDAQESTRVMGPSLARELAESTREPWGDRPTVANASAMEAIAATLGSPRDEPRRGGGASGRSEIDFGPLQGAIPEAVPEPLAPEMTPGPRRPPGAPDNLTPSMDQMASALAAAMNTLDAQRLPSPSFRTTTDVAGVVPPPLVEPPPALPPASPPMSPAEVLFDAIDVATPAPVDLPVEVPIEVPIETTPDRVDAPAAAPLLPAATGAGLSAATLLEEHLPPVSDGAMPLEIGATGSVVETAAASAAPLAAAPEPPRTAQARRSPYVAVALGIIVVGGAGAVWYSIQLAGPPAVEKPAQKQPVRPAPPLAAGKIDKPSAIIAPATAAMKGGLQIDATSTPSGATITVNGKVAATVTPTKIEGLVAGKTYTVEISLKGYRPRHEKWRAVAGKPWSATLAETEKVVAVTSDPIGAEIFLDGKSVGTTRRHPVKLKLDSPLGKGHVLTLSHAGYQSDQRTITADAEWRSDGDRDVLSVAANLVKNAVAPEARKQPERAPVPEKNESPPAIRDAVGHPTAMHHIENPVIPKTAAEKPALPIAEKPRAVEKPVMPKPIAVEKPVAPKPTIAETPAAPKPVVVEKPVEKPVETPAEKPAPAKPVEKPRLPPADDSDPAIKVPSWMKPKAGESAK